MKDYRQYYRQYQRAALNWWRSLSIEQMQEHERTRPETMNSPATVPQITWLYFELQEPAPQPTIPVSLPAKG